MKKRFLLVLLVFSVLHVSAGAQVKAPEAVAKDFYKWYLTELNAEHEPILQNKKRMLAFISTRLGRWVYSSSYSEYGADYFIDAQDWEHSWVNGISATAPVIKGTNATLRIQLTPAKNAESGFGRRVLPIKLVKEGGVWKIDMINNRKLTK
ncbi:MAG TPA: DUF3828 domain-containing protein [Pyrinomonadaceae bacterium]|nr:DUF3828 domain-containing protein [Pyrinomonadaceae bacterium]